MSPSYFRRMFRCDTARIIRFPRKMFLVIGFDWNTRRDAGQWVKNGKPIHFNYVRETVIASGRTDKELLASARHYKNLLQAEQRKEHADGE